MGDGGADGVGSGLPEGLVPRDALPARIGIAFRPSPAERVAQPLRVVDELRRRAPLRAERLAGRVRRIRLDRDEPVVLDDRPHREWQRAQ